ncbi:MAG: alpha/beta hydrolase [Chroococcales cyanobacterium]
MSNLKQQRRQTRPFFRHILTALIALSCNIAGPISAAERLTFRIGPLEQSVRVNDLEEFAETGDLPPSLKRYAPLLNAQVQTWLTKQLRVNPRMADKFLDELLETPDGELLIEQITSALPNSDVENVKAALYLALQQANGINAISFLRAYPTENITIDLTAALGIAMQLNASNLQSRIVGPMLERELKTEPDLLLSTEINPTQLGKEQVKQRLLVLRDRQRQRTIPVDLYYSNNPRGPLVLMSHGFAADRRFLTYLAEHLASYGFTVVSIEHPGSNLNSLSQIVLGTNPTDILPASEFIDRPKDVSFVLDELARINEQNRYLQGKFNTQQVTMIGHSLGGYTALALAGGKLNLDQLRQFCQSRSPIGRSPADWLQCAGADLPDRKLELRDPRIQQVMAFNPLIGKVFGDQGLADVKTPTLILSSSEDAITPALDHQLRPFQQLEGQKYLITAIGATHMSVTDLANKDSEVAKRTLMPELMGEASEPLRQLVRGVSLAFVSQLTPEGNIYESFLNPPYIQSFSTPESNPNTVSLQMRMTTELPRSTDAWLQVIGVGNDKLVALPSQKEEWTLAKVANAAVSSVQKVVPQPLYYHGQLSQLFTNFVNRHQHFS